MIVSGARPRVVVVGAGFGGLAVVRGLRREPVDVTLIDRNNYHLFQPLLYQVASGLLDDAEIAHPIRSMVRRQPNCSVIMATATGVDLGHRRVHTDRGDVAYDHLVVATGSRTNFFGHPHDGGQCLGLKDLDDALSLRSRLLTAFEQAAVERDPARRRRMLTVVIVGAGATGVEFTGAVLELIRHVLPRDYPGLDFRQVSVRVVDAGGSVLAPFAPRLQQRAQHYLEDRGAEIILGHQVRQLTADGVVLDDGRSIPAATVVWSAGVEAERLDAPWRLADHAQGRVAVTSRWQLPDHPEVRVIGDMAAFPGAVGPLPMVAPVAIQSGRYVARSIAADVHRSSVREFRYHDKGSMAAVGRNCAIVQLGDLQLSGFLGWVSWLLLHLLYIITFRSRLVVLINWAWNYVFLDRPVRLITRSGPRTAAPEPVAIAHKENHGATADPR